MSLVQRNSHGFGGELALLPPRATYVPFLDLNPVREIV